MKVLADTCNVIYCKKRRFSPLILSFIVSFFAIVFHASAQEGSADWFVVGDIQLGAVLTEAVQSDNIAAETDFLSPDTDDLRISLNNVRVSNGLLQFDLVSPFRSFSFCFESPLTFLFVIALPVFVTDHCIPCAILIVLIYRHSFHSFRNLWFDKSVHRRIWYLSFPE